MPSEFEVRREIAIEADPEQVWQAIATGPGITSWFMPHEVTPGVGGTVRLTVEGFESEATITDWEPGKRLAYRAPAAEDGTVHAMEFLIEGRDSATTVVRFGHCGLPALRAGLGLEGPIEVGRSVRLTPAGLTPLTGLVDYANEAFLGVRTADGLYRFHEGELTVTTTSGGTDRD